ncbi:hypothetical protein FORC9_3038 [Vibrio vulnificus]|nr:hypothetical protein FORC9_3038 [Vibrio vulnificus]ANH64917.1 hypothetical protein FORC16_3034 [Vibrio vulnificus]
MLIRLMCTFIPQPKKALSLVGEKCGHVTAHKKRPQEDTQPLSYCFREYQNCDDSNKRKRFQLRLITVLSIFIP